MHCIITSAFNYNTNWKRHPNYIIRLLGVLISSQTFSFQNGVLIRTSSFILLKDINMPLHHLSVKNKLVKQERFLTVNPFSLLLYIYIHIYIYIYTYIYIYSYKKITLCCNIISHSHWYLKQYTSFKWRTIQIILQKIPTNYKLPVTIFIRLVKKRNNFYSQEGFRKMGSLCMDA